VSISTTSIATVTESAANLASRVRYRCASKGTFLTGLVKNVGLVAQFANQIDEARFGSLLRATLRADVMMF
jgi:NADH:ubiquinone oxidoreductase subunit B-like Fe-S oxidoreductase